jgi:hypothetical protein
MSGQICMGKMKKTASMEIDFIKKLRVILPIGDQRFKDESSIFLTSINMFYKV